MVNEKALGEIHNFPVHRNRAGSAVRGAVKTDGVKEAGFAVGDPLISAEPVKNIRVNNGEEVLTERNFAER
jgi:hypothetical protein